MSTEKSDMRRRVLDARSRMSPFVLAQCNAELAEWMYRLPVELAAGDTVAAYVATRAEPGGTAMLDALLDQGLRVLLPIVPEGDPARLQWGEYRGESSLTQGRWRLLEPQGYRLDPDVLHDAALILVPAVAADRTGARLGRGAGYYDRTLAAVEAPVVAVVHDAELFDDGVPHEANDVPMDWVLTPGGGFSRVSPG
ncbi:MULTISPECIES: 5-formyltetrahydrofolate cyclo-ligase [Gordonia]|uniref:5-formyltetrahydrofolate cyclo-ligase n=2 Tax=Gordonia TaxID=2053 RepID=L7LF30_9ACTN|nr:MULTISPECIES: 5-formyltetrahydrofolate cyclo-ligase [Gordonia]KJR06938.1 5-formyltetrahydrofolate cyclo-ligase [Gordonia sihwensis]KXT56474.1 5-formyltetrahydrofolate cyclo-ligase [Gordonia sp. QH-12]WFN93599.1 5-formyltetrahydrofolate cyclo-ligase [Gordonia sihwensis]GAC59479.1 putative 5-formyltetrahydrofolate cyclo-ligase family protein [Gordonia sihwensis NBRC 108236]